MRSRDVCISVRCFVLQWLLCGNPCVDHWNNCLVEEKKNRQLFYLAFILFCLVHKQFQAQFCCNKQFPITIRDLDPEAHRHKRDLVEKPLFTAARWRGKANQGQVGLATRWGELAQKLVGKGNLPEEGRVDGQVVGQSAEMGTERGQEQKAVRQRRQEAKEGQGTRQRHVQGQM